VKFGLSELCGVVASWVIAADFWGYLNFLQTFGGPLLCGKKNTKLVVIWRAPLSNIPIPI